MFEIDSERTSLPLSPDRVLALVSSLNAPMVVAADMPVEPTRAYICAYQEAGDKVAFSIYLHRVESNKGAFYRYDAGLVPRVRFDDVMGEAMAFAESLGFMMDDLGWDRLDRARRSELMRETPLFLEPGARAAMAPAAAGTESAVTELVVDEATDAGVVGATPISPVPDPPAAPAAAAAAMPPRPEPPLATAFVPPPVEAPAVPSRAAAVGRAEPVAAPVSGTRELELTLDGAEVQVEVEAPVRSAPSRAPAARGAPPAPAEGRPTRAGSAAPDVPSSSSSPTRESPGAPPGPMPGVAVAAQALVRLLASL